MDHTRLQREPATSESDTQRTRGTRQSNIRGPNFSFLDSAPPVLRLFTHSMESTAATVQAKLNISQPGDQYELEADRVAEHVMRMPDPAMSVQRKCSSCEEEHKLQRIPDPAMSVQRKCSSCEEEHKLQRIPDGSGQAITGGPPSISQALSSSSGHSLDSGDRKFFEPRFGYDFGAVRIHADSQAAQAAQAVSARAFTLGRSIYFGANEYRPRSGGGRHLLAHELAHVVQQSGTPPIRRKALGPMANSPLITTRSGPQIQRLCSCAEQLSFRSTGALQGAFGINQYWPTVTPYWGSNSSLGQFDVAHSLAGWRYVGHKFQVVGRFSQQNAAATGRATFRQNARITSGTAAPGTAGPWINDMNYVDAQGGHHAWDVNTEAGTNGPGGNPGVRRTIASDKYAYTDPPALPYQPGVTNSYRKLQFSIHFRSAPGCPCAHAERTAHRYQEISIVNGVPTVLHAP